MTNRRVCLIFGTRPEAIKLGPVAAELRRLGVSPQILCSGQHTDLLRGTPLETDLDQAVSLGLASTDQPLVWVEKAAADLQVFLKAGRTDVVVVQGDTATALAGAKAAHAVGAALVHVEAGVRSGNWQEPWPEEMFRTEIDVLADLHLAPTEHCRQNLWQEGVDETVQVTGNTVVSALRRYAPTVRPTAGSDTVLVTLHRRELRMRPDFREVLTALANTAAACPQVGFLWPVHPAMREPLRMVRWPSNFVLTDPMAYWLCTEVLAQSRAVLTDSGGLTEEAAVLGVPTAVLRTVSDRPEAEEVGIAKRFAPEDAAAAVRWAAVPLVPRQPQTCFGTAEAAARCAEEIVRRLC